MWPLTSMVPSRRRVAAGGIRLLFALLVCAALVGARGFAAGGRQPRFERVYPLAFTEGVFAYARISPDGRTLAYASETPSRRVCGGIERTVTVVDLKTRAVTFREPG